MLRLYQFFTGALGLGIEPSQLTFLQITWRGIFVFLATIALVRLSDRRSLTKKTPFDLVLLVILGSVLARAINGNSSFFPTLGGSLVIVLLHRALAFASCRWPAFAAVIKGKPTVLVQNGRCHRATMSWNQVSQSDIEEDLRLELQEEDLARVKTARLEVSGDISFIMREEED